MSTSVSQGLPVQSDMHGFLVVDKAWGETSHDIVGSVRRLTGIQRVGHAGTLDPLATGVLLVCIGRATRFVELLMGGAKCYEATVVWGIRSASDDAEGPILYDDTNNPTALIETPPERTIEGLTTGEQGHRSFQTTSRSISRQEVEAALSAQCGPITQRPPDYSAVKQSGQPLYRTARAGKSVRASDRLTHIWRLALISSNERSARVIIWCSKGTYIRSLARDLGETLGCGAYLGALRRLAVGPFTLDDAIPSALLPQLVNEGLLAARLMTLDRVLAGRPVILADESSVTRLQQGQTIVSPVVAGPIQSDAVVLARRENLSEQRLIRLSVMPQGIIEGDPVGTVVRAGTTNGLPNWRAARLLPRQ